MKYRSKLTLLTAVTLCAAILLGSCSAPDNSQTETAQTETTAATDETAAETQKTPKLPDADYEGYTFKFLHWDCDGSASALAISALTVDAEQGELLSDAIYARNARISEKYDVSFTSEYLAQDALLKKYQNFVRAGEDAYDIVCPLAYTTSNIVSDGLSVDLFTLPYVDWSDPWWDANAVGALSINGRLPVVNSDLTLSDKNSTGCMVFNKEMLKNYSGEDVYALVNSGSWTIDKLLDLSSDVSQDVNGDGVYDEEDIYGISGSAGLSYMLLHGSDCWFVSKNADDVPELSFWNERTVGVCEKIQNLGLDTQKFFDAHLYSNTPDELRIQMFLTGHGLFSNTNISGVCALRAMDTDFGVLPIPKYDEAQENYYCFSSIYSGVVTTVPMTVSDLDRTAVILTALAADSHDTVQKEYIETTLKGKNTRDGESEEMMSLIIGSRAYDWGEFMLIGGFPSAFIEWFKNPAKDIASLYASYEAKMQADLEKLAAIGG